MSWWVRPLVDADATAVAEVFAASRAAAMPWLPVLHTPEEDRAFFARELARSAGWGVVDVGGRLLGFAIVGDGWLRHLYVAPGNLRQGLGRRLLEAALEQSEGDLQAWVFAANVPALAFYRSQGFAERERTDGAGNEEGLPDVRMVRPAGDRPYQ